jgi:predicted nucleic acid-binding protein
MNDFLLDASALAKRYSLETGRDCIDHLFNQVPQARLVCLMLGAAEVVSVLVRRRNAGLLSPATFLQSLVNFRAEVIDAAAFQTVAVTNDPITDSLPLLLQHSLNATDAVVLRLALDIAAQKRPVGEDLVLVAADQRLLRAAATEGVVTFDPENQSLAELDLLI